mgnify:CR=1 FL=1
MLAIVCKSKDTAEKLNKYILDCWVRDNVDTYAKKWSDLRVKTDKTQYGVKYLPMIDKYLTATQKEKIADISSLFPAIDDDI